MIVEFEGKRYERRGQCIRCGTCCTGFSKPCPQLNQLPNGLWECKIHEIFNTPYALKLKELGEAVCNPPGAFVFPESPRAIEPVADTCGFYFALIDG